VFIFITVKHIFFACRFTRLIQKSHQRLIPDVYKTLIEGNSFIFSNSLLEAFDTTDPTDLFLFGHPKLPMGPFVGIFGFTSMILHNYLFS